MIYPNFPKNIKERYEGSGGCALQEYYNGKIVKITGKLEYVVCGKLSQCIGEFWAPTSINSIEIIE